MFNGAGFCIKGNQMQNYEYAQATDEQLLEWELKAYEEKRDSELWEKEMRVLLWVENGGYRAGLTKPI